MPPQLLIRFHGTYRYESHQALQRAICSAHALLDDEDVGEVELASLRSFMTSGATLRVDIQLPAIAQVRFAAASVFQSLALDAVEGAVEASHGAHHVDFYPCGGDD